MPSIKKTAEEQDNSPIADTIEQALSQVTITTQPVLICGVNRKINIGNFENVDVYAGLALPLGEGLGLGDREALQEALHEAARVGFELCSGETGARYRLIKGMQEG